MRTWMDVYRQRQRRERELRFLEQIRLNRAAWSIALNIVDVAQPHGKRLPFEPYPRWSHWSTEGHNEA